MRVPGIALLGLLFAIASFSAPAGAAGEPSAGKEPAVLTVNANKVLVERFLGFGAEWDANGYAANGVTDRDFEVVAKRIRWMRLPVARVMMQAKYVYQGGGRLDFETPAMKSLCRHLDLCQQEGIAVILTEWGCEPQWLRPPEISKVDDPKYAGIIGDYLDHLLVMKGYSCIRYFVLVNEPNYEVKDYGRWQQGLRNVAAALAARKLDGRVALAGADHSNADDWHARAVKELSGTLGAYDFHRYASPEEVRSGKLEAYVRGQWAVALAGDPKAKGKPLIIGEAGLITPGFSASNNPLHLKYEYGLQMADYAAQAATAGSWSVLAWMLDDNSHQGFTWGMWANHENGLKPKPWFYVWALLARSFPAGAQILGVEGAPAGLRALAARIPGKNGDDWSLCLANRGDAPARLRVRIPGAGRRTLTRYLYSRESAKADADGFPLPAGVADGDLGAGCEVECPAESVVFLTGTASR